MQDGAPTHDGEDSTPIAVPATDAHGEQEPKRSVASSTIACNKDGDSDQEEDIGGVVLLPHQIAGAPLRDGGEDKHTTSGNGNDGGNIGGDESPMTRMESWKRFGVWLGGITLTSLFFGPNLLWASAVSMQFGDFEGYVEIMFQVVTNTGILIGYHQCIRSSVMQRPNPDNLDNLLHEILFALHEFLENLTNWSGLFLMDLVVACGSILACIFFFIFGPEGSKEGVYQVLASSAYTFLFPFACLLLYGIAILIVVLLFLLSKCFYCGDSNPAGEYFDEVLTAGAKGVKSVQDALSQRMLPRNEEGVSTCTEPLTHIQSRDCI